MLRKTIAYALMLFFIGLFTYLGIWQLQRAKLHESLLKHFQLLQSLAPLQLDQLTDAIESYRFYPVTLEGQYDNDHQFLLDNRTHQGRAGYHVLTPFLPDHTSESILIDRGWIPIDGSRENKPVLPLLPQHSTINGVIQLPEHAFLLGNLSETQVNWPKIIEGIDFKQVSTELKRPIKPFIVWLSPQIQEGFVREWRPILMDPNRNRGYAAQWFAMALTLLVILIVSFLKPIKRSRKK